MMLQEIYNYYLTWPVLGLLSTVNVGDKLCQLRIVIT